MSTHDLRRKAQRLSDLRRKKEAHEPLTDDEMAELLRGIPAEEMHEIVATIRGERRAAAPAKKVKAVREKVAKEKAKVTPVDIHSFLDEEHDIGFGKRSES